MNQTQIGRFIAECRKERNLTQMLLAEKRNLTFTLFILFRK